VLIDSASSFFTEFVVLPSAAEHATIALAQIIMKSSIFTATLLITAAAAQDSGPQDGAIGCFSALPGTLFSAPTTNIFNSRGLCRDRCRNANSGGPAYLYVALQDNQCFCGIGLPLASNQVAEERCSTPCPGYAMDTCGGQGVYTVLMTSPEGDAGDQGGSASSSEVMMSSLSGGQSTAGNGANIPVTELPYYTSSLFPTSAVVAVPTGVLGNGTATSTSIATVIPTAGAVSDRRLVGGVAAALSLGAVCNLL